MSGLKGNLASLRKFSQTLRSLPRVVAQKVTTASAPAITDAARSTFDASENPYGIPWSPGVDGQKVTLRKTGALARYVKYVGIGTKLRIALGVPYAKYQLGKRLVFPRQGAVLPAAYLRTLSETTENVIRAELGGAS